MPVLFLNHNVINCGVYQYGKRLYNIIKNDNSIEYIYKEVSNIIDYMNSISEQEELQFIIYNYHISTMPWLNSKNIQKRVKNIGIPHESPGNIFDIICDIDPNGIKTSRNFPLPRPIFENIDYKNIMEGLSESDNKKFIKDYTNNDIRIFGSFGFGFINKGFDKIVNYVNEQYDAAIIKLIIPTAHFDPNPNTVLQITSICKNIKLKEGIKLIISNNFFSEEELLLFLHSNTMNIFLYDKMQGRGISSTIDYALSVNKPLGISDSYMFRHIYSDNISLYKTSIENCLINSSETCSRFLKENSHDTMINVFRSIFLN
jgi:hypothetical protein